MQKEINWLLKEKYRGKPSAKFYNDIERLKKGEPLDYVIGFTEFLGCKIDLSKKPLIPRPETEYWARQAIENISYDFSSLKNRKITVLDMFAGSGCIGIATLKHIKNARAVFAEKDQRAIYQIKINCALNNINKKRYRIIQSDTFKNITGKYDYIFANPPYIPTVRKNKIQASVLRYEPKAALFGGKDGLFYIRKFLAAAKNFLNDNGKIYMEFDSVQKKSIEFLLKKYNYTSWEFCKDQYGKVRYVVIMRISFGNRS